MKKYLVPALILSTLFGCATSIDPTKKAPGFLPDYSLLTPVATTDAGTQMYRYISPEFKRSDYHAVIVDPVIMFLAPTADADATAAAAATKNSMNEYLENMVKAKFKLSTVAGSGIARIKIAITGAELEGDGLKLRNLIPVSAAITLATKATGYDNKHAVLIIEAKLVDSSSGKLLGEAFNVISSDKFRDQNVASSQFQVLAKSWIKTAVKNAAGYKSN